jgi:hypothetical protein
MESHVVSKDEANDAMLEALGWTVLGCVVFIFVFVICIRHLASRETAQQLGA